jgi:hypothetical protein
MAFQLMEVGLGTHLGQLWGTQILGHGLGHVGDVLPQELWDLEILETFLGSTGMPLGRVWDVSLSTSDMADPTIEQTIGQPKSV